MANEEESVREEKEERASPKQAPKAKKPGLFLRITTVLARPVSSSTRIRVLATTAVAVLIAVLAATFVYPTYGVRPGYDEVMVEIFILSLIPFSIVDFVDRRYRGLIDSRIPDFLREIGDSQRTGTPFATSLVNASRANYGPLSKELSKAMSKMSWGFTYEDALNAFADGANTALANRVAVLLEEVGRSGGKMLQVLDAVYEHIREVINLQ
ncbi:MAG: type II secretion system F family protein, partial [Nitrososphaerota archaeon]|nr:type II secretion system F family protein [Nitrososphaerota archaeon]